jgi:hypothetical protein
MSSPAAIAPRAAMLIMAVVACGRPDTPAVAPRWPIDPVAAAAPFQATASPAAAPPPDQAAAPSPSATQPASSSPPSAHLGQAAELLVDPEQWQGKLVEVTDEYTHGFETSFLGGGRHVWLRVPREATVRCAPTTAQIVDPPDYYRVHVIGRAETSDEHYGHMGVARAMIVASEVEYVDLCERP